MEIKCKRCQTDTRKRVVLKRRSLKDITKESPEDPRVKQEFICLNTIESFRPSGKDSEGKLIRKWTEETCENHILILNNLSNK